MKNVDLDLKDITRIRRALHLLEMEQFKKVEEVGVSAFEETPEEKEVHAIEELYDFFSNLEEELEEEKENNEEEEEE